LRRCYHVQNDSKETHPTSTTETHVDALGDNRRFSGGGGYGCVEGQKMKMTKQLTPSYHPTAVAGSHRIWRVGSGGGHNPVCQI